ncbi:hypothetical protein BH23CHL8_BH23CHL8_07980 [soil metagenome]
MQRTTVTVPVELIAEVDRLAGPRGRSAFVVEAIEARVKRERLRRAIEETRGVLTDAAWGSPEDVYRWVRQQRIDRDDA